jgi:uncharacterized protein (TIGR03437 family)
MYGGDSAFETMQISASSHVYDFFPQGFAVGGAAPNLGQVAYRQDWSAITDESPAVPGEIVHIYATGLGPVDCPVETGVPAPLDRLCRPTRVSDWRWETAPGIIVPAEVLFAGLAPGMVGLYQIDVRVPAEVVWGFMTLSEDWWIIARVRVRQP